MICPECKVEMPEHEGFNGVYVHPKDDCVLSDNWIDENWLGEEEE